MKDYKKFAFGDITREVCKERFGPYTPENAEKTVHWLHTAGRQKIYSTRMWKRVKSYKRVVIDDSRNKLQFTHFCKLAKQRPTVVYIYSPRKFRYKLLKNRARKDFGSYSFLIRKDHRELRQGLAYMIKIADFKISNRSTLNQLKKNTQKLLKKLSI